MYSNGQLYADFNIANMQAVSIEASFIGNWSISVIAIGDFDCKVYLVILQRAGAPCLEF